jgi:hypothetical protein
MTRNEGTADRVIRILLGIILLYLATAVLRGTLALIFGIIAVILLITGVTGFCLLYKLLGMNTLKKTE